MTLTHFLIDPRKVMDVVKKKNIFKKFKSTLTILWDVNVLVWNFFTIFRL